MTFPVTLPVETALSQLIAPGLRGQERAVFFCSVR